MVTINGISTTIILMDWTPTGVKCDVSVCDEPANFKYKRAYKNRLSGPFQVCTNPNWRHD